MRKCLVAAMVVCLGMAGSAWATGPNTPHTWEENFDDNVDPSDGGPDWYKDVAGYGFEDGMMTFSADNGWSQMRTLPPSYNNGATIVDIVFASDTTKGPQSTDGSGEGVGLWFSVGGEPSPVFGGNGITNGRIPIVVQLGWEHDGGTGPGHVTDSPTLRFGRDGGTSFTGVDPIHVANTGTVRVQMEVTVMAGDAGANVDYIVTDDANVVTTGSYTMGTIDFDFFPIAGGDMAVLNWAASTGAIDYLKVANFPDGVIPSDDGDFDDDGDVDGADFLKWQRDGGSAADLTLWEDTYGNVSATANLGAVPEPSSIILLGLMFVSLATRRRRRS